MLRKLPLQPGNEMCYDTKKCGGNTMENQQFYFISDRCVACGRCALLCPESCINVGVPYEIDQEKCVLCGTCFNVCHKGAVEKRETAPSE